MTLTFFHIFMTRLPCECDAGAGGLDAERGCAFGEADGAAGDLRPAVDERAAQAGGGVFEQLRGDGHLAPGYGHDLAIVDCAVEPVMSRGGYSGIHTELDVEFECVAYDTLLLQNSMAGLDTQPFYKYSHFHSQWILRTNTRLPRI